MLVSSFTHISVHFNLIVSLHQWGYNTCCHPVIHITHHSVIINWLTFNLKKKKKQQRKKKSHINSSSAICLGLTRVTKMLVGWGKRQTWVSMTSQVNPPQQHATLHLPLRSVITFSARVVLVPVRKGFIETHTLSLYSACGFPSISVTTHPASAV